jgi:hypothetical protein
MGNALRRLSGALVLSSLLTVGCNLHPQTSLTCSYVPKGSEPYATSEIALFENCGRLTENGITLDSKLLRMLYFDTDGLGYVLASSRAFYVLPSGQSQETVVYESGADYFVEGLARGISRGKIGFINHALEFEIAPAYDFAFPFDHGHAVVCNGCVGVWVGEYEALEGGVWGVIDRSGRVVIPLEPSKDGLKESPAYRALGGVTEADRSEVDRLE